MNGADMTVMLNIRSELRSKMIPTCVYVSRLSKHTVNMQEIRKWPVFMDQYAKLYWQLHP